MSSSTYKESFSLWQSLSLLFKHHTSLTEQLALSLLFNYHQTSLDSLFLPNFIDQQQQFLPYFYCLSILHLMSSSPYKDNFSLLQSLSLLFKYHQPSLTKQLALTLLSKYHQTSLDALLFRNPMSQYQTHTLNTHTDKHTHTHIFYLSCTLSIYPYLYLSLPISFFLYQSIYLFFSHSITSLLCTVCSCFLMKMNFCSQQIMFQP